MKRALNQRARKDESNGEYMSNDVDLKTLGGGFHVSDVTLGS